MAAGSPTSSLKPKGHVEIQTPAGGGGGGTSGSEQSDDEYSLEIDPGSCDNPIVTDSKRIRRCSRRSYIIFPIGVCINFNFVFPSSFTSQGWCLIVNLQEDQERESRHI